MSTGHERHSNRSSPLDFAIARLSPMTLSGLQHATASHNVILAYQRVIQTDPPGHTAFYQGRLRVIDYDGGFVPAGIRSLTLPNGLSRKIDCLTLALGLHALAEEPSLRLSIAVSAGAIWYPEWMRILQDGIRLDESAAERLILEITESSVRKMPEAIRHFMAELQDLGISFSLGGCGMSSATLSCLRDFSFDMLRIDGQFIHRIQHEPAKQVMTQGLQKIAHHFDMFSIAECVASAEEATYLAEAGISCLQGPYIGAPTTLPPWKAPGGGTGSAN